MVEAQEHFSKGFGELVQGMKCLFGAVGGVGRYVLFCIVGLWMVIWGVCVFVGIGCGVWACEWCVLFVKRGTEDQWCYDRVY